MLVCFICDRVMEPVGSRAATAWIKQTKTTHDCQMMRCPRCGTKTLFVDRSSEYPSEDPLEIDQVLDLVDLEPKDG